MGGSDNPTNGQDGTAEKPRRSRSTKKSSRSTRKSNQPTKKSRGREQAASPEGVVREGKEAQSRELRDAPPAEGGEGAQTRESGQDAPTESLRERPQRLWGGVKKFGAYLGLNNVVAVWGFIAAAITIIPSIALIAFRARRPAGRCEEIVQRAKGWVRKIGITSKDTSHKVIQIEGKVDFRTTPAEMQSSPPMDRVLADNQVELMPLVREITGKDSTPWAVQQKPMIQPDGTFEGWIVLGGDSTREYEIVVLAAGKGCVTGDELKAPPSPIATSNSLLVESPNGAAPEPFVSPRCFGLLLLAVIAGVCLALAGQLWFNKRRRRAEPPALAADADKV
jgi:hypothetical protein